MPRSLRILTVAVLLVQALPAWPAGGPPLPAQDDRWIRVETAHFTLFSNAAEERTVEIGLRLETLREALSRILPTLRVDSPQPLWTFVFKSDASFSPYKRRTAFAPHRLSGSFAKQRDANFLAINAGRPIDPWRVLSHEYFHYFLSTNFTDLPLWFNEGIAECFSTFDFDEGRAEIGEPPDEYVHMLRQRSWIPLEELFRVDATSKEYNQVRGSVAFYAESWLLVHFILWGDLDGRSNGLRRLAGFPAGESLAEALKPVLGADRDGLQARALEYARHGRLRPTVTALPDLKIDTSHRSAPMGRAAALQRLGDLLMRSDVGRQDEAEGHFREALRLDPALAAAYTGLGMVRDAQDRFADAAGFFEKAIALDPDDAMPRLYYGESLLRRDSSGGSMRQVAADATPPGLLLAREHFRKAIRLQPGLAEAYAGFGATFVRESGPVAEGIAALEKVLPLLPLRSDVIFNLAALYARQGDRDRAEAVMEPLLSRSRDPEEIARGRETLLQAEYARARDQLNAGDTERGLARLKNIHAQTHDPAMKQGLALQIADIEQTVEANRQLAVYNEAVDLANRGSYRKATRLLEDLLREATDPDVLASARTLLARIRRATGESGPK